NEKGDFITLPMRTYSSGMGARPFPGFPPPQAKPPARARSGCARRMCGCSRDGEVPCPFPRFALPVPPAVRSPSGGGGPAFG
ncbi:hypothetical protein ACE14D_12135, partial [Streptomyces sp. Act-28]